MENEVQPLIEMLNTTIKVYGLGKGGTKIALSEDVCSRSVANLRKIQQIGDEERAKRYMKIMKGSKEYVDFIIVEVRIYIYIYICIKSTCNHVFLLDVLVCATL